MQAIEAANSFSNTRMEWHTRREAGKRNTPYLHEANGAVHVYNRLGEIFSKEIPEEVRVEAIDQWRSERKKSS